MIVIEITKRDFFAAFNKEVVAPLRPLGYKGTAPRWSVKDEVGNECLLTGEFDGMWITPRVVIYAAAVPALWEEWFRVPYSKAYDENMITKKPMHYHGLDIITLPDRKAGGYYTITDLEGSIREIGEAASRVIPKFTQEALDVDLMRHKVVTDTNYAYGYIRDAPLRSELATFVLFPYGSPESRKAEKALKGYRGRPRLEQIFRATLEWREGATASSG